MLLKRITSLELKWNFFNEDETGRKARFASKRAKRVAKRERMEGLMKAASPTRRTGDALR